MAILLRIASGIAASAMVASVKAASLAGVNAGETVFYRSAAALPLVVAWVALGPGLRSVATARPWAHATRAALGLTSMTIMFVTIGLLPIAEFTAFLFLVPLLATILSAVFLNDKVGIHRWSAILVGFAGVLVMTRPGSSSGIPALGMLAGLVTASLVAGVTITLRQISATEPATTTVFWFTVIGTIVTGLALPFFFQSHDLATWLLICSIGVTGALLQIAQTISLGLAPVSITAPFDYLQLVWSMLLGWLIWSTLPAAATMSGAVLICAAGLYTLYREQRRKGDVAASTPAVN